MAEADEFFPLKGDEYLTENVAFIRTSDRSNFRRCKRKFNWSYLHRGNRTRKETVTPLWLGTGMHFALEDFHGYHRFERPSEAFDAYVAASRRVPGIILPQDWEESVELMRGMLDYYLEWLEYRDPQITLEVRGVPQVEVRFQIPLPLDPSLLLRYGYDRAVYTGTIDRVILDEEFQRLWLVDYKSAKTVQTGHFETDPQITAYCVPLNSEILTARGWRQYSELSIGEPVLGYNTVTDQVEWTLLEAVHRPGMQDTVTYSNKSFEFTATPEHKWLKSFGNRLGSMRTGRHGNAVIMAAAMDKGVLGLSEFEAQVLGWILTDGTWGEYERGLRASISQQKPLYQEMIQNLLDFMGDTYTRVDESAGTKTWHLSMPFFRRLWEKTGMNFELQGWEEFVTGMTLKARQAFCSAALLGDGSVGNGGQETFYQKPGIKQELFKLAFFLCGKFPTKLRIGGKGNPWSEPDLNTFGLGTPRKWEKAIKQMSAGQQEVWCPQTGLSTWIMRQGGQITITGNCWAASQIYTLPVAGFLYQQHRKAVAHEPDFLKSTRQFSVSKSQLTTHTLYAKALRNLYGQVENAPDINIAFLNQLASEETERADKLIRLDQIERNPYQIQAEGPKILAEAMEMLDPNLAIYPNPTRDCSWDCDFRTACLSMDDGSDWEYEIETGTMDRDQEDLSWRKFLKYPEREVPLPRFHLQHKARRAHRR